ncbi:hypothetical protein D8S78_02930 [Natrialba swarupiae]|nr:hypothetical protein [Natrialba swarupiae]
MQQEVSACFVQYNAINGRRIERRTASLAVIAVICAVGGLVLAASAMPMLAADAPVSGLTTEGVPSTTATVPALALLTARPHTGLRRHGGWRCPR